MFRPIKEQSDKNNLSHFSTPQKLLHWLYREFSLLKPATIISSNLCKFIETKESLYIKLWQQKGSTLTRLITGTPTCIATISMFWDTSRFRQFWPEKKIGIRQLHALSPSYYGRCDIIWEHSIFLMGSIWTYQQMLFQSWLVYVLHMSPPTLHLDVLQSFLFYDTQHWLLGWDSWNLKQSRKVSQNI